MNRINEQEIIYTKDFTQIIKLKKDHEYKPVIAVKSPDENPHIILEAFNEYYKEISEFLVAIGEPIVRTKNFQEYELNPFSLYSAASMNIKTDDIITILENISKNELQKELKDFIEKYTRLYGKARLIIKNNRYFIECQRPEILKKISKFDEVMKSHEKIISDEKNKMIEEDFNTRSQNTAPEEKSSNFNSENVLEISEENIENVKYICDKKGYPLLEEYDFKKDEKNLELKIAPKYKAPIRTYQDKALNIMCSNGRARSGIIVLPCGAGKTLVGILAICTIKKNTVIICNNSVAVEQWRRELENWVDIDNSKHLVARFIRDQKDPLWKLDSEAGILITSYTMISYRGSRNSEVKRALDSLKNIEWGLMIIDEVQLLPADSFRIIAGEYFKAHCKLGLTATLVREDSKIQDLYFLIGPKHYEANWLDLQKEGYLARVKCTEIWCEMDQDFYLEYFNNYNNNLQTNVNVKKAIYVSNPNKFLTCLYLLEKYKGNKIIIFSDNLFTINQYTKYLQIYEDKQNEINKKEMIIETEENKPIEKKQTNYSFRKIDGKTSNKDRNAFLKEFKKEGGINVLLMTKVGDISIDIPNANVIIQVSSHFGSRMQEAQRFGRILRPKKDALSEYNAFFYTIVSKNTEEMKYSNKRHRFLVDQGYYFNIINEVENPFNKDDNIIVQQCFSEYKSDTLKQIQLGYIVENDINDEEDSHKIILKDDENYYLHER